MLETPAHALPPVRMLWRSMLGGFKVSQKVAGGEEEKMVLGEGEEESEGKTEKVKVASLTQFAPTESDELAKIFKARLVLGAFDLLCVLA